MSDPKTPPATPKGPPPTEKELLEKTLLTLAQENKSLKGQLESCSPETIEQLKKANTEIKTALLQLEKDLARELLQRKLAVDATAAHDRFQFLKNELVAYCTERKIDPALWKKLESL